ncbi:hypothetical protein ACHAXT_001176 [Thalassiosira profunda]
MYLLNDPSAFSPIMSASDLNRVASFNSTPANASRDKLSDASSDWHIETCASATSSSISPNTANTDVISSPMLSRRSCSRRWYSSSSPSLGSSPVPSPRAPLFGGFSRQAPLNLRVASDIRAPHLPKVRALALMSRSVSVSTTRLRSSRSMYDCKYGESDVKEGIADDGPSPLLLLPDGRRSLRGGSGGADADASISVAWGAAAASDGGVGSSSSLDAETAARPKSSMRAPTAWWLWDESLETEAASDDSMLRCSPTLLQRGAAPTIATNIRTMRRPQPQVSPF